MWITNLSHKILTGRREQMLSMRQKDGCPVFQNVPRVSTTPLAWALQHLHQCCPGYGHGVGQLGTERKT